MISVKELNEIKEKKNTTLYYEEKEYLQYVFLNAISKYSENSHTAKYISCLALL